VPLAQLPVPENLLKVLGQIVFLLLFVLLPVLQKRAQSKAGERDKRTKRGSRGAERTARHAERQRGEQTWREMLEGRGGPVELEELPSEFFEPVDPEPVPFEPAASRSAPLPAPATRVEPRRADAARSDPVRSGPVRTAPAARGSYEDLLESGAGDEGRTAPVSVFELNERGHDDDDLVSLEIEDIVSIDDVGLTAELDATSESEPAPKRKRAGMDWRRAVVLSELLARPVALREHGPGSLPR
jgi:hypothetical protein